MSAPKTLNFSVFRFVCEPLNEIRLPVYAGATLRGAFGYSLKHAVCVNIFGECEPCILKQKCVYEVAFVTPRPTTSRIMRKYYQVPRPFVLSPPFADNNYYQPGEELVFKLTLVGKAIDYLPFFIYAFDALGKMGLGKDKAQFRLLRVEDALSENKPIYNSTNRRLSTQFRSLTIDDLSRQFPDRKITTITIRFLTPTRLMLNGKLHSRMEFHVLIRNLLRRLRLLSYFHCDADLQIPHQQLIATARLITQTASSLHWYDWERNSTRTGLKMKLGGAIGEVTYTAPAENSLTTFLPYLYAGQYLHVGKATTFGLGEYKIMEVK